VRGGELASRACTCAADGLTIVLPSPNSSVGTVWLPPLTLITNSAAASSRSMSTSVISTPTRFSCAFRRLQNPHQLVVYIVSGTRASLSSSRHSFAAVPGLYNNVPWPLVPVSRAGARTAR
jgi:hypothetical protein